MKFDPNHLNLETAIDETLTLAEIVFESGNYPEFHRKMKRDYSTDQKQYVMKIDPDATIRSLQLTMLRGRDSGLSDLVSIYNITWYNDRPSIWGDAALAIIRKHPQFLGISERYDEETRTATCDIIRLVGDEPESTIQTFSWDDAEKAKLHRLEHYRHYGPRMLKMRARSWCIRDSFADALNGLSIAEEQRDIEEMRSVDKDASPGHVTIPDPDKFTQSAMAAVSAARELDFSTLKKTAIVIDDPRNEKGEKITELTEDGPTIWFGGGPKLNAVRPEQIELENMMEKPASEEPEDRTPSMSEAEMEEIEAFEALQRVDDPTEKPEESIEDMYTRLEKGRKKLSRVKKPALHEDAAE